MGSENFALEKLIIKYDLRWKIIGVVPPPGVLLNSLAFLYKKFLELPEMVRASIGKCFPFPFQSSCSSQKPKLNTNAC